MWIKIFFILSVGLAVGVVMGFLKSFLEACDKIDEAE